MYFCDLKFGNKSAKLKQLQEFRRFVCMWYAELFLEVEFFSESVTQ